MNNDPRGTMFQQGDIMRINNAYVEDVSCSNNSSGSILVSYAVREPGQAVSIQQIRLNLNRQTTVTNAAGQNSCICCIRKGMWVNVGFSPAMTRSIPPQSNAFWVAIQRTPQVPVPPVQPVPPIQPLPPVQPWPPVQPLPPVRPWPPVAPLPPRPPVQPIPPRPLPPRPPVRPTPPQRPSSTTTGRIARIDFNNRYILLGSANNPNDQTRFNISNATVFTNRFGAPIRFGDLRPGQMVRITHSNAETLSIPPQSAAFRVQVL